MSASPALWLARRCSRIALAVAGAGVVLVVGTGTLFFDDPHASYPRFLRDFGLVPLLVLGGSGLVSRLVSRRAELGGRHGTAVAAALLPLLVVGGAAVRIMFMQR